MVKCPVLTVEESLEIEFSSCESILNSQNKLEMSKIM